MSKIILALTLVLGFLLNTAAQEANDFVRYDQFHVCKEGMGLTNEDLISEVGPYLVEVIWECVDETSYTTKALNFLLYRPNLLEKRVMENMK